MFGVCAPLLMRLVHTIDLLLGPVLWGNDLGVTRRMPTDDLQHVKESVLAHLQYDVCEDSLVMRVLRQHRPEWGDEELMKELRGYVSCSRYLDSLFSSLSFYYECCLDYTAERVAAFYGRVCAVERV